jgi:glycosyltransferase involved in cell wall biosynthesis
MQVVHIFNSSGLNGPERLVLPALCHAPWLKEIWSLHELRTGNSDPIEQYCREHHLPFRQIPVSSRFDRNAIARMRNQVSSVPRPAIFHSHDAKASVYTWAALWPLQLKDCRSIVTHHGAMARPDHRTRIYEQIMTHGSRIFASRVLSVCTNDYENLLTRGIPERKLRIHRNGIDLPAVEWKDRRAAVQGGQIRMAIVGRLSPEKNHRRLLSVLNALNRLNCLDWSLDVLGDGPLRKDLEDRCHELGIESRVRFLGYCADAWLEFDRYACLLNFSAGEGFPVTILEAGLRRTPVFASAVGGIPELCGAGGAELFDLSEPDIDIANRLAGFCVSENEKMKKAENLFRRVSTLYSQARWLSELEGFYLDSFGKTL